MTERRKFLIAELGKIQNHKLYHHQDIMTITMFMNDDEVLQHILRCIKSSNEAAA